jgi:hypothetical protein
MIRLTFITFTVWLAMVLGGTVQSQTPPPLSVAPPEGITLHYTNSQLIQDRTGALFAATRAKSEIGGVVWMVKDGTSTVVLQLGPEQAFGNGELVVWPDGYLMYVTVDQAAAAITAHRVEGWTP